MCSTCGKTTHKVTPFRTIPLENEFVHRGICLKCHPEKKKVNNAIPPVVAGGKASKLLGGGSVGSGGNNKGGAAGSEAKRS